MCSCHIHPHLRGLPWLILRTTEVLKLCLFSGTQFPLGFLLPTCTNLSFYTIFPVYVVYSSLYLHTLSLCSCHTLYIYSLFNLLVSAHLASLLVNSLDLATCRIQMIHPISSGCSNPRYHASLPR